MKHPVKEIQENQDEFLANCPAERREFHARIFRTGNAAYVYHQQAHKTDEKRLREYYAEWLEGLPPHISADMKERGFEYCKAALSFTRYVNERNDLGMRDWMKEHLSEEDFKYYMEANNGVHDDR